MSKVVKPMRMLAECRIVWLLCMSPAFVHGQTPESHEMHDMPGMSSPEGQSKEAPPGQKPQPQGTQTTGGEGGDQKSMEDMPGMEHGQMPGGSSHDAMPKAEQGQQQATSHDMEKPAQDMQMGPMQGGKPPPDARDPNAYAEGTRRKSLRGMEMADDERFGSLLINKLEYADGQGSHGQNLDAEAWYGGDYNKLWLKAEGERRNGRLDGLRTEALWSHALATFWDTQLGVRHDNGEGGARNWLAIGVQGLAPYWFETEATAYAGTGGALAARIDVKYELLFTQRLILQPNVEANLYSKDDPVHGIGSGLSDMELSLRLRYEIKRRFAPYIGISWRTLFGKTADFARAAGQDAHTLEGVVGIRMWF